MIAAVLVLNLALAQEPAAATAPPQQAPELAVIDAKLGDCSADFTVTGPDGAPIYAASIQVRIRYGFMSVKRMDLEVATNSDGKARVAGLPKKAKPLTYEITKGDLKSTVSQNVETKCTGAYDVALKEAVAARPGVTR